MELTAIGSYSCAIDWNELETEWNLKGWSTKKPDSLGTSFLALGFSGGAIHFYRTTLAITKTTCYDFKNFQDKPRNLSGVFTKTFPQPHCMFFFWNRPLIDTDIPLTTDIPSALGSEITCSVHWPRKFFLNLSKIKSDTDYFQNIRQ